MISPLRLFDLRTTDVLAAPAVYQAALRRPCQLGQTAARSACGAVTYSTSRIVVTSNSSAPMQTTPSCTRTAFMARAALTASLADWDMDKVAARLARMIGMGLRAGCGRSHVGRLQEGCA